MKRLFLMMTCLMAALIANGKPGSAISDDGELRGKITSKETAEPLIFASISIIRGDQIISGTVSDDKGNYKIKPLAPGSYSIKATYVGYQSAIVNGVLITAGNITFLDLKLSIDNTLPTIEVDYTPPLVDPGEVTPMTVIPSFIIEKMPLQSVQDIAATAPRVFQKDDGEALYFRGSRNDGTLYIVDGIKMPAYFTISRNAIAQISVITGGIPAQYGDVTGGIVIITTKSFAGK